MTVNSVGDIVAKTMPQHAFTVIFIYFVLFAEGRKSMPAVVWGMPFNSQFFQFCIHVYPVCAGSYWQQTPMPFHPVLDDRNDSRVDGHCSSLAGPGFDAAKKHAGSRSTAIVLCAAIRKPQ